MGHFRLLSGFMAIYIYALCLYSFAINSSDKNGGNQQNRKADENNA